MKKMVLWCCFRIVGDDLDGIKQTLGENGEMTHAIDSRMKTLGSERADI